MSSGLGHCHIDPANRFSSVEEPESENRQLSRVKRAYVIGHYGFSNFGDDLFAEVLRTQAARLYPGYRIKVVGGHTPKKRPSFGLRGYTFRLRAAVGVTGSIWRILLGVWVAIRADVIVLGGGSTMTRVTGVRAVQSKLAKYSGTSFEALGVSIGPLQSVPDRKAVAKFGHKMDRIIVRDRRSLRVGQELGLTNTLSLGGDLAALYDSTVDKISSKYNEQRAHQFGLALCNFQALESSPARSITALLSRSILQRNDLWQSRVTVISMNNHPVHGDDRLSESAADFLRTEGVNANFVRYADLGVNGTWDLIASLDGVVAVRLHAAIAAYLSGVPFTLFEYHAKCSDFSEDVDQNEFLRMGGKSTDTTVERCISELLTSKATPRVNHRSYIEQAKNSYFSQNVE